MIKTNFFRYSIISKGKYDMPLNSIKCGKEYFCAVKENKYIDVHLAIGSNTFVISLKFLDGSFQRSLVGHNLRIRGKKCEFEK